VAAGSFARVKRFDGLIEAVRLLRSRAIDRPLEIYGRNDPPFDAAYDAELAALAAATPGVRLRPYDPRWADALREEDVFVHPTAHEGFGIVMVEAYARGCRVVVPRGTVLADLPAGPGLVVVPGRRRWHCGRMATCCGKRGRRCAVGGAAGGGGGVLGGAGRLPVAGVVSFRMLPDRMLRSS
jgi:glycosyltransferase involved in cell wall biosynthesis